MISHGFPYNVGLNIWELKTLFENTKKPSSNILKILLFSKYCVGCFLSLTHAVSILYLLLFDFVFDFQNKQKHVVNLNCLEKIFRQIDMSFPQKY